MTACTSFYHRTTRSELASVAERKGKKGRGRASPPPNRSARERRVTAYCHTLDGVNTIWLNNNSGAKRGLE